MLIVIGLMVGSILVGQDLIRAAEVRKTISEFEELETAVNLFYGKFGSMPGDFNKASTFFGATNSLGEPIHDGDGDGKIETDTRGGYVLYETMAAWGHVSSAGILPKPYAGVVQAPGDDLVPGWNVPISAYMPDLNTSSHNGAGYALYSGNGRTYLQLGWDNNGIADGETVVPLDAYNIDKKVDDGLPGSGKVRSEDGATDNSGCLASATEYDFTASSGQCTMKWNVR